ncbi:hypothetical protein DFH06DRAFT_1350295 [Mycena polygramma]|nr:hypothetical protein DFH06DRAFT_1350295 [Mycena polygramma]
MVRTAYPGQGPMRGCGIQVQTPCVDSEAALASRATARSTSKAFQRTMRFDLGYLRCCTCRKSNPGFGDHAIVVQLAKTGEGVRGDIPTVLGQKSTPGFGDHVNVVQRATTVVGVRGDTPTVLGQKSTPSVGDHANVVQRANTSQRAREDISTVLCRKSTPGFGDHAIVVPLGKTGEHSGGDIPTVLCPKVDPWRRRPRKCRPAQANQRAHFARHSNDASQCTSVDDQTSPWRASEATIPLSAVVSVAMHRSVQGRHLGGTVRAQSTPVVYLRGRGDCRFERPPPPFPPPFPPLPDLDHDGPDQEPKEAPSQTRDHLDQGRVWTGAYFAPAKNAHQVHPALAGMKYIDDIADEVAEDGGEDAMEDIEGGDEVRDDEDSMEAIIRRSDHQRYRVESAVQALDDELAAPAELDASTGRARIHLPEILSRSATPRSPDVSGTGRDSCTPTPLQQTQAPRAPTPLFLPADTDTDDSTDFDQSATPGTSRAGSPSPTHGDRSANTKRGLDRAPSGSPPPLKRRRVESANDAGVRKFLASFMDLEADDAGDEEEESDDAVEAMASFIDDSAADDDSDDEHEHEHDPPMKLGIADEPMHHPYDLDRLRWATAHPGQREREEAARFVEMARQEHARHANPDMPAHDIVARLPHQSDPGMYRLAVPRGSQMQLLQYLQPCQGIKSVFYRERGTQAGGRKRPRFETVAVYVETDDLVGLQQSIKNYPGVYAMPSRDPVPIDIQDRVAALNISKSVSPVGRWARVRSGSVLYKNDLVFVKDEAEYLVVPRVPYGEPLPQSMDRANARLFDAHKFQAAGNQLEKRNQLWIWQRQRVFAHGLEQRPYVPSQLILDGVIPTDDEQRALFEKERALFEGSSHDALNAPFVGRCCALQEGDRVVVAAGKHSGDSGYIVALTDIKHRAADTGRELLVRVAAVLQRYDCTTAITRNSLQMAENPAFFVPVAHLRLHALAMIRSIQVGDRVLAVGGHAQGICGRVESVSELGQVTLSPLPPTERVETIQSPLEVEMRHLQRQFRVGDVAEVNRSFRSVPKGTVGFITEVCTGGFVHLYQRPLPQLLSAMKVKAKPQNDIETVLVAAPSWNLDPTAKEPILQIASVQKTSTEPDILGADSEDEQVVNDPVIYVPTTHLNFALFDDNGLAVHSSVSPNVRQELDEQSREWEKMKMSTGRGYIGCEVMIAGKQSDKKFGASSYARKGLFGTVMGYTLKKSTDTPLTKTREQRLKDGRTSAGPDVELYVRYDASLAGVPVKLNQVVERYSKLPLEHVMHLRGMFEIMAKHRPVRKKGSEEQRIDDRPLLPPTQAWYETSREPEPLGHIYGPPRDIGEDTGHWLRQKELVGKRIDIKIEGVAGCLAQYGRIVTQKVLGYEGKRGFVKIDHPLSVAEIEKKLLECRTIPMHHPAKVPPASIKPYRLAEPDALGIAHCISSVVGRVIIIGPNVHGVTDRVGQYAESVPSAPAHAPLPTPIVEVRFPLTLSGERPPNEEYHLESLCRALNETLHSCDIPATDFDAAPTKW